LTDSDVDVISARRFNAYTFRNRKVTRLELGLTPDYDKEKA
jgi:hypothetical protein